MLASSRPVELTRSLAAILACLLAGPAVAIGQRLEARPVPAKAPSLADGSAASVESFSYLSPSKRERYALNVAIPVVGSGDGRKFPALIVTDGDFAFPTVLSSVRNLEGVIEPIFIVSIGNSVDDGLKTYALRRIFEFSPPNWDKKDPFGEALTKACLGLGIADVECRVGGSAAFLNTIVSEIIPLVAAKYPIDTTQLGLFGVSAGGFFASWVIFQPLSPFKKYLLSSPAMAYGNGAIFREEERYAKTHKDLPISIYMGAGTLEANDPFLEGLGQIVSGMTRFAGVLAMRQYPGLRVAVENHAGLGHNDVVGTNVVRGLRTLYMKKEP